MKRVLLVGAFILLPACSSGGAPDTSPIPGFVLTRETTKCMLGSHVAYSQMSVFDIWGGAVGEFKIDVQNGAVQCLTTPDNIQGPDSSKEVADVRAYFIGAGVPEDQLGATSFSYSSNYTGTNLMNVRFAREFHGVFVSESIAWASIAEGSSWGEDVYWPTLPAAVASELDELQSIVSDTDQLAAYTAKLPSDVLTGTIVIHHTSAFDINTANLRAPLNLVAHACYDALVAKDGQGTTQCFLADGTLFTFPSDSSD